jgi:type II secretory pathway pseudopilin PulG
MKRTLRNQRGLSLTEVTIMLSVLSVLTAVLSPTIGDYVNDARQVKASDDVKVLASTFSRFAFDVPQNRNLAHGWATTQMLVGPGDAPATGEGGDATWAAEVDGSSVALLEDHLMVNTPGYPARQAGPHYVAGGWRGAYLSELTPDPWGHRYAINVQSFSSSSADVIVLSSGPNGLVETAFDADGVAPGGDDIIAVIAGGR